MNGRSDWSTEIGDQKSLSRTLASHSVRYGLAGGIGKALALLTVPYLTRTLSPEGYGLAELATSLAALLTILAMFGGDLAAARMISRTADASARRSILTMYVLSVAILSTLVAVSLVPLVGAIAANVWDAPARTSLVVLALVLVPLSATQSALVHVQRLELHPTSFAALSVLDLTAQLALAIVFVSLGMGASGVLLGFVVGSAIGLAAAAIAARHRIGPPLSARLGMQLVREGAAFLPATALFIVADYALRAILANAAGEHAVGYYAVALRIASILTLATYAFSMAWGSYGFTVSPDRRISGAVMSWYLFLAGGLALGILLVGPEAVLIAAGSEFRPATPVVPGLMAAALISGAYFVLVVSAGLADRAALIATSAVVGAIVQVVVALGLTLLAGPSTIGLAAAIGQATAFLTLAGLLPTISRPGPILMASPVVLVLFAAAFTYFPVGVIPAAVRVAAGAGVMLTGLLIAHRGAAGRMSPRSSNGWPR